MLPGRPHRLPREDYKGEKACAFTANTWDRAVIFDAPERVDPLVQFLERAMTKHSCFVPIYCFMPDHLHVMFRGRGYEGDCLAAMSTFKHLSGLWMKRKKLSGWQPDFFDLLRSGTWQDHVKYIAQNPVRAGLVANCFDYPFLGSIGTDLRNIILPD